MDCLDYASYADTLARDLVFLVGPNPVNDDETRSLVSMTHSLVESIGQTDRFNFNMDMLERDDLVIVSAV